MHDVMNKQADCTVLTGSNLDHLPTFADCVFDSCVTDPPYELGFMGKAWDKSGIAYSVELWREVYRVLKPGAYLLAFGGSRTYHRMACAIEDAGFEIRDQIQWIYGSGFPKSLDVSKQLDLMVKNEWLNISKAFDNVAENEIINLWKRDSKTVKFAELSSLKNVIVIGIATPKNDSVQSNVQPKINPERLPLDVIIAELNLSEALPTQTGRDFIVPENAGAITTLSHSLVITVESLLESPNVKPCLINSIAQCGVRASESENTEETIKGDEALKTWLGKSKSLTSQDVNALSAGLIDGLKLTILNHSKTFQNLDTISQTACASAITVTITESTAVSLISFTVDTLRAKALDKAAGAKREVVGQNPNGSGAQPNKLNNHGDGDTGIGYMDGSGKVFDITAPATDDAKTWDGWGTALKPAHEPIVMARVPLEKGLTVAQNVLKWGTGAINVDGCRVETEEIAAEGGESKPSLFLCNSGPRRTKGNGSNSTSGRFPANVIYDGSDEVLAGFPVSDSHNMREFKVGRNPKKGTVSYGDYGSVDSINYTDSGSAARFFYSPKASKYDREAGLDANFAAKKADTRDAGAAGLWEQMNAAHKNHHPTVKPTDLMQYLCRLVTPPGGLILEPFLGSGSTAKAALIERFRCVGIELNPEYAAIADARCKQLQVKLF